LERCVRDIRTAGQHVYDRRNDKITLDEVEKIMLSVPSLRGFLLKTHNLTNDPSEGRLCADSSRSSTSKTHAARPVAVASGVS
jgi:hypothetical protein